MQVVIDFKGNNISVKQNNIVLYNGERELNNNETYFSLKNIENKIVLTVNQYKGFLKSTYDIITYKNERKSLDLIPKSMFKATWIIEDDKNKYDIICHRGTKVSIFKNDKQIANVIEKVVNLFNSKTIVLNYNKTEIVELLIGIALAIYGDFYNNAGATLNFNLGHIGPEMRKFDHNWRPEDMNG